MLSLAVVILLSVSAYQVEAGCWGIRGSSGCFYKGVEFKAGEELIIDCIRVTCEGYNSLSLCDFGTIDRESLNDKCKVVTDRCYEKAVLKSDESKDCPYPTRGTGR